MIISQRRGYIFVHIPKTGGTSLNFALDNIALDDDILIGNSPKSHATWQSGDGSGRYLWKHSTLSDTAWLLPPEELEHYFTFAMVRNPWDRIVSSYTYLRMQTWLIPSVRLAKSLDFSSFLNHPMTYANQAIWNSSASYMLDANGVERATLYVRAEQIEADIHPFETHLGIGLTPLERLNTSKRAQDWRGYYSDADAALVARHCTSDIDRFGYSFDPV